MCGIAGIYRASAGAVDGGALRAMTRVQSHRGPDEEGYYEDSRVGLGQRRLSIIDLAGGRQPIHNEDRTVWTVFNGEIFNYVELRQVLVKKGHRFHTHTDTEVIVHGYEEWGADVFTRLNGQFAIAIWDTVRCKLVVGRDRVGIRPLYYARRPDGGLLFASEMKALFCHPGLEPEIDPVGIDQIFTYWVNVPPRTVFKGIQELPPGCRMTVEDGRVDIAPYWKLSFPDAGDYPQRTAKQWAEGLREILEDSITLQLRADVPVAAYLSGGLDSSIISALVKKHHNPGLVTFSVAFRDGLFDERPYQEEMSAYLGTSHKTIEVDYAAIGSAMSDVVWYAEKPMIRTAPAPLYLLAGLVRRSGIKVVLTGEGADEIFGGYNIFKEDKLRRFWARQPDSKCRPKLLSSLYPYINKNASSQAFWRMFFRKGLTETGHPHYSHRIRWDNTSQVKPMFTEEFRSRFPGEEGRLADLQGYLDPDLMRWDPLCRAQYLETALFMSGYLLSSQGDRMMMGQSIEGRFPFLDHRVIEYAASMPPNMKLNGLDEKHILKRSYADLIPPRILNRPKQPYRAPIAPCFLGEGDRGLAGRMLSPEVVRKYGYFDPDAADRLVSKLGKSLAPQASAREEMALVGMVSLHLLHHHFIEDARSFRAKARAGSSAAGSR